jgi:hypothetical protein
MRISLYFDDIPDLSKILSDVLVYFMVVPNGLARMIRKWSGMRSDLDFSPARQKSANFCIEFARSALKKKVGRSIIQCDLISDLMRCTRS